MVEEEEEEEGVVVGVTTKTVSNRRCWESNRIDAIQT